MSKRKHIRIKMVQTMPTGAGSLVKGMTYDVQLLAEGSNWIKVGLGGYGENIPTKTLLSFEYERQPANQKAK